MRNLFIVLLVFMLFLGACGSKAVDVSVEGDGRLKIVTTIFPVYDFVRAIVDDADVTLLIRPGMDIHSFDPSVADVMAINQSDVFIYIGGKSDAWVQRLISPDTNTLRLIDFIEPVEVPGFCGEVDEHIWTSPANAAVIAGEIAQALQVNADDYIAQLNRLDEYIKEIITNAKRSEIIVADRFTMRYFADYYNLDYQAALPACTDHGDISAAAIVRLINTVRDEEIGYVFYGEFSDKNAANMVCSQTGAGLLLLHSVQNVSREEFETGQTYLSLMYTNAANLRIALND
jgi:zinc transport system substrate-binding protein